MPVFRLDHRLVFPDPDLAEDDGLLAVGGDLSKKRLLLAYSMGIFPWYSEGSPILWWSPDPRLVLMPDELRVSRSLKQVIKKGAYRVTFDTAFERVLNNCAAVRRKDADGTWITGDMAAAYLNLHRAGCAHSVESWYGGELAGGLYGVSLGGAFFGESMFTLRSNASKVAFVTLVEHLLKWGFSVIDCQVTTEHMLSFGAREISRRSFMDLLGESLDKDVPHGPWKMPV